MTKSDELNKLINLVEIELLPLIDLKSVDIHDPVVVEHIPNLLLNFLRKCYQLYKKIKGCR